MNYLIVDNLPFNKRRVPEENDPAEREAGSRSIY